MKRRVPKMLMAAMCMIMISGTSAFAATTEFTFVLNAPISSQNDPISKRTMKSSSAYEATYYVTPTYFTSPGWIRVRSNQLNTGRESKAFDLYSYEGRQRSCAYGYHAPADIYYYLKGEYGRTYDGGKTIVKGRYTP